MPVFGLIRHLDGTVPRPFAYRILADWLVRLAIFINLPRIPLQYLDPIVTVAWQSQHVLPYATYVQIKAYTIVASGFVWGFLLITYLTALRAFRKAIWAAITTVLGALIVNSLLLHGASQPYDFLTLFFSSLLFLAALKQNDIIFVLILPIAFLSKESLFLFVPVYALIAYRAKTMRRVVISMLIQTGIFLGVYGWERARFASNDGTPMYHDISGHLRLIFDYGDLSAILKISLVCILLLYRLPLKPIALRRSMLVLPILLLLYFIGGAPGEFRIIFDIFPIILLPISGTLLRLVSGRDPPDFLSQPGNYSKPFFRMAGHSET